MTQAQLVAYVVGSSGQGGSPAFVGVYVASQAQTLTWTDKTTGQRRQGPSLKHSVQACGFVVSVQEFVESGQVDVDRYKAPWKTGERVVLSDMSQFVVDKGNITVRGKLSRLEVS